jgi:hypothetical protein
MQVIILEYSPRFLGEVWKGQVFEIETADSYVEISNDDNVQHTLRYRGYLSL